MDAPADVVARIERASVHAVVAATGTTATIEEALMALTAAQARVITATWPAVACRDVLAVCLRVLRAYCAAGYRA